MRKNLVTLVFVLSFVVFGAGASFAQPNLNVLAWQGPASPQVESPYQYKTRVKNIGNAVAQNVKITIDFPLANTSPTNHILGKLSAIQSNCSVVSNKLVCNLQNLNPNQTKFVTFNFELQVSTNVSSFKSTASTTTAGEINPNNNFLTLTPNLTYPNNVVTAGNYLVTLCTGTNLTSFYACELYPSSQQSFTMTMNGDQTITIPNYPTYGGFWDQYNQPTNQTLHFTVGENSTVEAEFNGFATSATCFEGITTFPQTTGGYNSAYQVCRQ